MTGRDRTAALAGRLRRGRRRGGGALAVGSVAGLAAGAAGQVVFLLVSAWLAMLAWSVGWPPPSAAGRTHPARREPRS